MCGSPFSPTRADQRRRSDFTHGDRGKACVPVVSRNSAEDEKRLDMGSAMEKEPSAIPARFSFLKDRKSVV